MTGVHQRDSRGGSRLAKEIAGILTGPRAARAIDEGDTQFLLQLHQILRSLIKPSALPIIEKEHPPDDFDADYRDYAESSYEESGLEIQAHLLSNDEVLRDSQLFVSRRMRKMEQEYEHLVRFVSQLSRKKVRWTQDRAGLTRLEEMCELRPSDEAPGTIGVFAKQDIPVGTKLQYSGVIIDAETRRKMLDLFVSTTDFEFPAESAFAGYHLIGNPMRMGMQIIHTPDQDLANCDIEFNRSAANSGTIYSDVVVFHVPDKGLGDSDQQGILEGQELLTFYSKDYFIPQPLSCDRCRLLGSLMRATRACAAPGCQNARHHECFLSGEKLPAVHEPFTCEDHRDRSYNFYFLRHLNNLREKERRRGGKVRDTRSGRTAARK